MNTTIAPESVQQTQVESVALRPASSQREEPHPEFTIRDIARAFKTNKMRMRRTAEREAWPSRTEGNKVLFTPPANIASVILATPESPKSKLQIPTVKFCELAHSDAAREKVLLREAAVKLLQNNLHLGKETALQLCCQRFANEHPLFPISVSSLRRWFDDYTASGLDGLVEQKRGRVGKKAFAADLDPSLLLRAAADATEHGIKGRLNVARAFHNLVANPTVEGPARAWLHGDRASKSSYPPSFGAAVRNAVPPLAAKFIQIGPKAAKLDGPFTECHYDNVPAGKAWTADDMTANVYVWCQWPNEQGFLLIRPQILAVMDIGTMMWMNIRAVMRPKGQYNKDDVWGLIGDKMDKFGLHRDASGRVDEIAVLEGGTWQSGVVIGTKTGLSDEERFGGLKALGVKVIHTRTPRGKIIEPAFNNLQHAADNCKGFCGRMEMKDCPEIVRAQLRAVASGKAHPREFFMSIFEYSEHLVAVMQQINHERNDGKILKGRAPVDKWAEDLNLGGSARAASGDSSQREESHLPGMFPFPDESKWMYRAAYRVSLVTRNGVRISVGSGKYQTHYTYGLPEVLETHRGRRVVVFWNDNDPDTDAVIYTLKNGKQDKLICVAPRVQDVARFGATDDEMHREAARKKVSQQACVAVAKSLAPYLQRNVAASRQSAADNNDDIGAKIAEAREAALAKNRAKAKQERTIRAVEVTAEDMSAATEVVGRDTPCAPDSFNNDEIADIFRTDKPVETNENIPF